MDTECLDCGRETMNGAYLCEDCQERVNRMDARDDDKAAGIDE